MVRLVLAATAMWAWAACSTMSSQSRCPNQIERCLARCETTRAEEVPLPGEQQLGADTRDTCEQRCHMARCSEDEERALQEGKLKSVPDQTMTSSGART